MSYSNQWLGSRDGLTARESQVIALCADGLSNQEIADALFVNIETVKSHLKRAYGRLGLRNRAEVATYVHQRKDTELFAPMARNRAVHPPLAEQLGLTEPVLAERRRMMGLSSATRTPLTDRAGEVAEQSTSYAARLLERWHASPTTAPYIASPEVAERLARHQAQYLQSLFGSDLGDDHVEMVLRIGATHHRLQLPPQWHLASYAHLIGDHLDLLHRHAGNRRAFLDAVEVLVRSVLFDASLMLDAYEMHLVQEILDDHVPPSQEGTAVESPSATADAELHPRTATPSMSRLGADLTQVEVRLVFIGLDAQRRSTLRGLAAAVEGAIPGMLDDFYSLVADTPSIAELVDGESTARLMAQVDNYWRELMQSGFDRSHAASRMRVGMVHERIGLAPQFYVAGLAQQLGGILGSLESMEESPLEAVDALVRAVFFDLTFVIDAYVEARAVALVQTERFANQLIASLSTGVAIIDARNRIEVVNQQLLDMVLIPAAAAHRMPVADALPFSGILELIDAVRDAGGQRRSSVVTFRDTTLRLTMVGLQLSTTGRVGLVVDDITAIMRLSEERVREERRFLGVLSAVGAVAWEIDGDSLLITAVSAGATAVLGRSDHELLGRVAFTELLDPEDRPVLEQACRDLGKHRSVQIEHSIRVATDGPRRVRTTIAASRDRFDNPTISGVSILAEDED